MYRVLASLQATRFARVCLEEALTYAMKRKTFGKPLVGHPVIRWKIAEMARAGPPPLRRLCARPDPAQHSPQESSASYQS